LPVGIGIISAKGNDVMLADLIKDFLGRDAGVKAGRVAFDVYRDAELEQKIL
jgi:hypothetical protein